MFPGLTTACRPFSDVMNKTIEWKQVCRVNYKYLTVYRMILFGGASVIANVCFNLFLWEITGKNVSCLWILSFSFANKTTRSLQDDYIYSALSPEEEARLNELEQSDIKYGYLATSILDHTTGLTISFMIWVVASVVILLSPTVVRDRLNRVQNLQYSSATGRRILSVQTLAAISSAVLLTVGNCMIYGGMLISKGALRFKEFYLLSHEYVPWVNWTYGTYLLVLAAMSLVIGITTAILTVFLSRYSQNYIGMLLKALPLLACLIALFAVLPIVTKPFFMFNPMSVQLHRKGVEIILLGSLFLFSCLIMGIALIRQQKKQIA